MGPAGPPPSDVFGKLISNPEESRLPLAICVPAKITFPVVPAAAGVTFDAEGASTVPTRRALVVERFATMSSTFVWNCSNPPRG
jgi:hypothetical protein